MKLFHELITEYADRSPDKAALSDQYGEMSYRELDAKSAAVSHMLADLGVKQGDAVAVYVPFTKDIMLGAVAALRTGCIYIPFDGAYPKKRLEYMLEDSSAAALLTIREFWEHRNLDFPEEKIIFLDEVSETTEPAPVCDTLTEDSPAMLLYTSGTTGKPKGVLHTQRMLLHIADCAKLHADAAMNTDTRSGVMSSFPFVATQMFLLGPLTYAGTVCIAPEAARKDMALLYRFLKQSQVTHTFITSGLAAIMAEDYDLGGIFVFAAGEKLRNFSAYSPKNILINLYGSTEACPIISKKICGNEARILVGKTYNNTKTQIVDDELNPVKPGETGELLVSNDYMSTGYFKLPELTAEKWIVTDEERWFRTGDRAAYSPDGDIDILGRTDNMIKLRGYRIETGEVEAQISGAVGRLDRSDVGQIVVTVRTIGGTEHLTCYYEAKQELDKKAVTDEISAYLAKYMIPDVWMRMDTFPRNLNGKVMRNELPQPQRSQQHTVSGIIDSEVLARIVYTTADVLDIKEFIDPDDRFTDLGGTSITAMKLTSLLREQGIKITSTQVLGLNVLRKIADAADVAYEQLWSQKEYSQVLQDFAARGERIEKVLPLSSEQDEMLFNQLLHPDRTDIKKVFFLQVDSLLSEADLRYALDIVADRNEELRSAVVYRQVTTIQQVITDRRIPLEMIRADKLDIEKMTELKDRLLHTSLDPQRDSLLKVVCVQVNGESFIYVMIHRIAFRRDQFRMYLAQLMQILGEKYPDDTSISDWQSILEMKLTDRPEKNNRVTETVSVKAPPEMFVYSDNEKPKMVFVHTANTGSAAYYRLATRIGDKFSFAVIEPFNLYHMEQAVYGIQNLAKKYIEILKRYQPKGPYLLGGWCYGGIVAHEMACQLEQAGEEVRQLIMLDSHAIASKQLRKISGGLTAGINREYFETCPLFAELREAGMIEAMLKNAIHSGEDMVNHSPSLYHGNVLYFKPQQIPGGVTGESKKYWERMMEFDAGNYENFCLRDKLRIVPTPHEHDLMMDDPSLDIIVPEILEAVRKSGVNFD